MELGAGDWGRNGGDSGGREKQKGTIGKLRDTEEEKGIVWTTS